MLRECWEAMISLTYNATTKKFSNAPNVLVRPRDFGGIAGVANLFSFVWDYGPSFGAVYEKLANILIDKTPGYKDHLNVRGAPYDFRLLADEEYLQSSYLDLQGLIEETYEFTRDCPTGPKRIHVMTHSLGGPYYLYFLNTFVSQEWKDMYLESFLSFSTPFHGAQMAYRTAISGDSEGLPGHNYAFLPAEKIMGGLLWMIPYANIYGDQEFVQVGNRTYTAQLDDAEDSLPALFRQLPLDRSDVIDILRSIITKRTAVVEAPNTRLYCIYGSSIPTEAFDVYKDLNATTSDPDMYREPVLQNDKIILAPPSPQLLMPLNDTNPYSKDEVQGDKIVEQVSLRVCNQWVGNNGGADVFIKEFPGYHHVTMLSQQPFLDYVMAIINESNSNNNSNN